LNGIRASLVVVGLACAAVSPAESAPEYGIDRSNMGTQWELAPPSEPNTAPFLAADYNQPGNFEARRIAIFDGIARLHPQWFRDGFGKGSDALFVDMVHQVHSRGIKVLAVFGPNSNDYPRGAQLTAAQSGCQWGAYPLSKVDLQAFAKRIEAQFQAVRAAQETVDAFEVGNEYDLYCNNADNPTAADWAKHHWQWFLSPAQVNTFVSGYGPVLATAVAAIRKYFPAARIITFGLSMPVAAPLIQALSHARTAAGKTVDYTNLVDGYGLHIYPTSDTTLNMVKGATASLVGQAQFFPNLRKKPIWITEWNPTGSSFWNGHPWYFQYSAKGQTGGDLNKADAQGVYPAMDRAQAIRVFQRDVIERLRSLPSGAVNIGYVLYYSYDSAAKSSKCDAVGFNRANKLADICFDGVINPATGTLIPAVAAAVMNTGSE
jgi:hypothetical protein